MQKGGMQSARPVPHAPKAAENGNGGDNVVGQEVPHASAFLQVFEPKSFPSPRFYFAFFVVPDTKVVESVDRSY